MDPLYTLLLIPVWCILLIIEFRKTAKANRFMRALALTAAILSLAMILIFSGTGRLLPAAIQNSPISTNKGSRTGLIKIGWADEINLGDSLIIRGEYVNGLSLPVGLYLTGFGLKLDSCIVRPGSTLRFTLKTVPKITGHFTYTVKTNTSGDYKLIGTVPVQVAALDPLHILIVNSSPSFENKYLKDWLSINKNSVAMLSLSSAANYQTAYQNMAVTPLRTVNSLLLTQFDLLIIDVQALKNLTAPEFQALTQAITGQGLGLIIQQDSMTNYRTAANLHLSGLQKIVGLADTLSRINIDGAYTSAEKMSLLPVVLSATKNAQTLVLNQRHEILANLIALGKGKIIQTVIDHSYFWLLRGEKSDYAYLWSTLLNNVSKKKTNLARLTIETRFPREDLPVLIHFITPLSTIPGIRIDQDPISMRQNEDLQHIWSGTYWPRKTGWFQLLAGHETSHWFYVYSTSDWSLPDIFSKQQETTGYVKHLEKNKTDKPFPLVIIFLIFIISLAYLWLEQKFDKQ